jgi:hypothetical protein
MVFVCNPTTWEAEEKKERKGRGGEEGKERGGNALE